MNIHRNHSIATGVAVFVVAVLATVSANAQPDRHSRNRVTPSASATMLAQQTPSACANPTGSDSQARAAREATRNGRLDLAIDAWNAAIQMCPSPDLFEGLGRAHEGLAALAVDDPHRLTALEAELGAFRQALALAEEHPVQGYPTEGLRGRINALEPVVENLRRRLTTTVVVPPHPTTATCANTQTDVANCGACGHRCGAGLTCTAGTCRAVIATPPVVTPTSPNRTLARALWIGGAVTTVTGVVLGTIGHLAAVDRDAAAAQLSAPASQRCQTTNGQLQCLAYAPNATRPDSFAGLETPGWIVTAVGAAAVIAGVVMELRGGHTAEGRPSPTVRPSLALGPDGTPMAGLGGTF